MIRLYKLEYERKLGEGKSGKEMFGLAWDVKELRNLNSWPTVIY